MFFKLGVIVCLLTLFYQDIRYRAVNWVIFPILLFMLLGMQDEIDLFTVFEKSVFNLAFLILQFALITIYFSLKNGQLINLTNAHIGWGDLLFLLTIAFYLPPINFLAFYLFSLVLILIVYGLIISKNEISRNIPLAGIQAFVLFLLLLIDWRIEAIDICSDEWLYAKFFL